MTSPSSKGIQCLSDMPHEKVLVIGAGPVGLSTALRLAQAGIVVDVIEKEPSLGEEPRAVAYYASALIALHKMGVIPDIKKAGFVSEGFYWCKPICEDGQGGYKMGCDDPPAYL